MFPCGTPTTQFHNTQNEKAFWDWAKIAEHFNQCAECKAFIGLCQGLWAANRKQTTEAQRQAARANGKKHMGKKAKEGKE